MADSDIREREQATSAPEPAAVATHEKSGAEGGEATTAATVSEEMSPRQDAIHNAFVARIATAAAAPPGTAVGGETAAEGLALRRAYLTHLAEGKAEALGEREVPGREILRSAYLAHTLAEPVPQATRPGPVKQLGPVRAKRTALSRQGKAGAVPGTEPKLKGQRKASGPRGSRGRQAKRRRP